MSPVYEYTFTRRRVSENIGQVGQPADTVPIIRALLDGRETEGLVVLLLNTKNVVIGAELVYSGSVSSAQVRVGELFRSAVRMNATSIIIAHNHPSGDPVPSPDDLHLTAQALAAGRLLDIDLLDHIIVAESSWSSLRERGIAFAR